MKELSVFIPASNEPSGCLQTFGDCREGQIPRQLAAGYLTDESGDFGEIKERPAYYLVTFVFHNQDNGIEELVSKLEESVRGSGFDV